MRQNKLVSDSALLCLTSYAAFKMLRLTLYIIDDLVGDGTDYTNATTPHFGISEVKIEVKSSLRNVSTSVLQA